MSAVAQSRKYRRQVLRRLARLYARPVDAEASQPPLAGEPPAPGSPPLTVAPLPPGFELPTARQVVGRGLQLAADHAADLRRASLYVGLLILATAGPVVLLFLVDLPSLLAFPWTDPSSASQEQAVAFLAVVGPLYGAGACALLGVVTVSIDGVLVAVALLGSRAVARPLTLRESIQRARQVFWRYGVAAFAVGIVSTIASTLVGLVTGALGRPESIGSNLLGTLVATIVTAPFGYILTAIVIGDVEAGSALRRSVTLARARPRLAVVVAVFAFLASTLEVLGIGVAFDVAGEVGTLLHPSLDPSGPGLFLLVPIGAAALVAFGSLALTVSAISAAPQITAFLGLTHFSAGLDRARSPVPAVGEPPEAATELVPVSAWAAPRAALPRPARWVTIPMLVLVALECLIVAGGLASRP